MTIVPFSPTATNFPLENVVVVSSSVVVEDVLLFLAHEITVRLKRKRERIMSRCFIKTSPLIQNLLVRLFTEPYIYHDLLDFTRIWGFYLEGV